MDILCAIFNAIVSVIIYLLIVHFVFKNEQPKNFKSFEDKDWYNSLEFVLLASIVVGCFLNSKLLSVC